MGRGEGGERRGCGEERVRSSVPDPLQPIPWSPTHRPGPQQLSPVVNHSHQDLHHSRVGLDKAGGTVVWCNTAPPSLSPAPMYPPTQPTSIDDAMEKGLGCRAGTRSKRYWRGKWAEAEGKSASTYRVRRSEEE